MDSPTPTPAPDIDTLDRTDKPPVRRPTLELSVTQIVGGSLAAATAAALSSSLGVAGTIIGAATFSVITAVAGALYTQSLRRTRERVRAGAALPLRARRPAAPPPTATGAPALTRSPIRISRLLAAAAVVFVVAFAGITAYELLTGAPISGGTAGTTLNEVTGTGAGDVDVAPEQERPAGTPSVEPTEASSEVSSEPSATTTPAGTTEPVGTTTPPAGSTTPAPTPSPTPTAPATTPAP